jgi:radical SAM superfamily enzyme YgiQ (UPF0313 family)
MARTDGAHPGNGAGTNGGRRALLVYPEFPVDSYWNFRRMHGLLLPLNRHGYPKAMMPPLGLMCILPVVREKYGEGNVRLVDLNTQPLKETDLEWATDVYLSGMLTQGASYDEVARRAKALGKTTVGGGPYASAERENLDHIFINESEHTLRPFLDALFEGKAERLYEGAKPEPHEFFRPDYTAIEPGHYAAMTIQFSRGCPHDCEFCDITTRYGRKMRTSEVSVFLQELDELYRIGWRGQVFIIDDNFIGKPQAALELLEALAVWQTEHGYPFELFTQLTVLLAEKRFEPLLKALRPAGFSMVFLGIESPNEESLRETNKTHNLRPGTTLVEKLHRIQEVGEVLILGGFIVGFDNDPPDIFEQQVRFIEEIRLPTPMVALLSPLPETQLDKRMRAEGRMLGAVSGAVVAAVEVTYRPKRLTVEELIEGYKHVLRSVYLNMEGFYARCLASLAHVARPHLIFKADELLGMFRLFWLEGVRGRHRGAFWRYLLKVALRHPTKLPYGLRWAAYGLHYRLLTEKLTAEPAAGAGMAAAAGRAAGAAHPAEALRAT